MSKKTIITLVITVALSFTLGAIVNADGGLTRLTEVYLNNDISVVLNGALFNAKDPQDGSVYVPLTYKGRTYLPLRAVSEAVGMPVDYDDATKTAYLGTKPNTTGGTVQEVYINVTPEYGGNSYYYVTKKINAEKLTTSTGKTFEFGYCGDTGCFMSSDFQCDFKFKKLKFTFYSAWDQKELETGYATVDNTLSLHIQDEHGTYIKKIDDIKHGTEMEFDIDCIDYKSISIYCTGGGSIIGEPKFVK